MMIKAAKQSKINVAGNAHVVTDPAINTADTTAPIFAGATVNGNKLLMTYTETLDTVHTAAAKAFTVKVDGVANAVQAVLVNAAAKTVTLTLTTAVSHGAVVRVGYTDPSGNNNINAIQDAAGNDALTLTAAHVTNNTPDTTAPVFASAEVNGGTLVMTYSEALDAAHSPAAGKFAVAVGGVATIVTDVAVNAAAKTVILTLKTPVERNDAVTVSYTDPSLKNNLNAIQDAVGNDALSLVAQTVLNATPADTVAPVFAAAAVNGSTLVLTYGEALDATHIPAAGKFAVAVGGVATIVTDVAINAAAKTVILTLKTPVERNDAVTVSYTDPSVKNNLNAIQDAAGNDALSLVAQTVINTTPADTVAPIFAGAAVNGSTLVMTYGEVLDAAHMPAAGKFAVAVGGIANIVTDVAVNAAAKTVILTLKTPVDSTDVVTVGYTDPSGSNNVNAIQDAAGNDALSIVAQTVINTTPADTVAPIFASAAVNGSTLVMTYGEALDAAHSPVAGKFAVAVGGVANIVTDVAVNAAAKTVVLTLKTPVVSNDAVTVSYTDPSLKNNLNAIQDAVGNDALSLVAQTVLNATPADTVAPIFAAAAVNGSTLVMTYGEALDAAHSPVAGKFAVAVGGVANIVTDVAVNAAAKTVILTLKTPVVSTDVVTVGYTDPSVSNNVNAIQDAAGNDALSIVAQTVINTTPADTVAPVFAGAAVNGNTLVMTYGEALDAAHSPVAGNFAVAVDGVANIVTDVAVNAAAKTVVLSLTTPVVKGNVVTVGYTDPSVSNDANAIQDTAGNDAITITIAAPVTNITPADITAPVFASAAVNGGTLVMTYNEALDAAHAPVAGNFAVAVGGVANVVTAVAVNAAAKTVVLTLTTPVINGNTVTVGYTDPSTGNDANAIQDAFGNDALSIATQTVINTTPIDTLAPVFAAAAVNGGTLVMTYNETLDAAHAPIAGSFAVAVGGVANAVTAVAVNAAAKTVVLTLTTPVVNGNVVTVGYTDPSVSNDANTIQDALGNDALSIATRTVINTTPIDTLAPVFAGAAVNGGTLVMTYNEALDAAHAPVAGNFAVAVEGVANAVTAVAVNAAAKTVVLTLTTPVINGNVVTVGYTDPSTGNDANAIQDALGNDAFSIAARTVINTTPADTLAPIFADAAVDGGTLVMTYNEALDAAHAPAAGNFAVAVEGVANAVTAVAVNAAAKTVTLTLSTPVVKGNTVTVGYTDPSIINDANAIQDASGNDALSIVTQTVTNNTPDSTAPVFAGAVVDGSSLVMTYSEALDAAHAPVAENFAVAVEGVANAVTAVIVDAAAMTVTLTLSTAVTHGAVVTVGYTDPSPGNDASAVQDAAGNDTLSIPAQAVTNNTPDTTAPIFAGASVNGNTLVMTYNEANTLDAIHTAATSAFAVKVNGDANAVTAVAVDATAKTVTLTLTTAVTTSAAVVTVAYTDPSTGNDANAVQDAVGNDAPSIAAQTVTNTTAPVFVSAFIDGATLVMAYNDATTLDAIHTAATTAFAVKVNGNSDAVASVAVNAAAKTVTLTLGNGVNYGDRVTVAYTDPSTGNDVNAIQNAAGYDAATIVAQTVTNYTSYPTPTDNTAPTIGSVTIASATGAVASTLNVGDVVSVTVPFSETVNVTGTPNLSLVIGSTLVQAAYASGTGTNSLTFTYTILANQTDANGISIAANALALNSGTIKDVAGNAATLTHAPVADNSSYLVDTAPPTVNTISIASATGIQASTLNTGDVMSITVPLTEVVTVTGTPQISLVIGNTDVLANYSTGTGTNSLTFTYTILAGQTDTNGIAIKINTLALNSGMIVDTAGNAATLANAAVTDNASYMVDTTAPTAPTGVTLTPQGGTVVVNAVNSTNTNLNIAATVVPGQATGGKAEFYVDTTKLGEDSSIAGGDSSVTYTTSDGTPINAELQTAIIAGGVVTVKLFDAAGNNATSTASNPTLAVDYTSASIIPFTTVGAESVIGTSGNDTFTATYGDGLAGTFNGVGDILNGDTGTDTLNITIGAEATTSLDADWTNISNIEKVVFNSLGNGAQSITAGTLFNAAFTTANVDLTAQTLLGAISIDMNTVVKNATITTTTIGDGAHTITTGSGVTTVNATALAAGAQTINGVGLATVNATVNGAGDQIIGTTHGENLVTVNATIVGAGAQTITSTSGSDATVNATAAAGVQTIVTGVGNDTVTTTGAAGQTNTITTNAGNDTIVASLGTDLITGGLGADSMTGGGATDTFAAGNNGSIIGTSMDVITDFNTAGADALTFDGITTLLTADATALVATSNVNTSTGGLITFAAGDNNLALKTAAIEADAELDAAGSIAMFVDSGNTYVYYAGAAIGPADDQLIQLTGIDTLVTITGGSTTVFA